MDKRTLQEIVASIARQLRDSPTASLALANLPCLMIHANVRLGPDAQLIRPHEGGHDQQLLHVHLTQDLFQKANIRPCGTFITRTATNTMLLVWHHSVPSSEHQLFRMPLLILNLLLDAPRPITPSETTVGTRSPGDSEKQTEQRIHSIPSALSGLIVPCGHRKTSSGDKSFEDDVSKLRARLEAAETGDSALAAALDLALSGDSKWGFPDQLRTRLIEYTVALESLLLDQEVELSYRFALRLSTLLAPTGDRVSFFEQARSVYKLRSNAVHAGARAFKLSDAEVEMTRRLLRLSILRYVALKQAGWKRKDILERLDLALLSPSVSQEIGSVVADEDLWPIEAVD
jgi:hypothetical protein